MKDKNNERERERQEEGREAEVKGAVRLKRDSG